MTSPRARRGSASPARSRGDRSRPARARAPGRGVVLAVAVEVDRGGVALVARQLKAGADRGAETARTAVRHHARAPLLGHGGCAVARAVVDHQDVERQAAGLPRRRASTQPSVRSSSRATTIARQRRRRRLLGCGIDQRPSPRRLGCVHPQQRRDGGRELEYRARLGTTAPGTPSPQTTNGTGRSPQSRWPWPPIPGPGRDRRAGSRSRRRACRARGGSRGRPGRGGRSAPAARRTPSCACRARGRSGRRRAAVGRAGPGPPRRPRALPRREVSGRAARSAAPT